MGDTRNTIAPTEIQPTIISNDKQRRLKIALWLLAIVLGVFHAWSNHHYLGSADAMSYLDIAEAYLRRDWHLAFNAYWSPLYSWVIALVLLVARPSPYWKFAVLHLVNFGIYLFALGSFSFLMREMMRAHRIQSSEQLSAGVVMPPDWALLLLGYSLFIWSSLFLITIPLESPDMLVAAFIYLACAIVMRIRRQPFKWGWFICLGITLGAGFLAKSVMLPLTPVFLIASMFAIGSLRRALPRVLLTLAFFVLVAGPFVFALSRTKGYFTAGQTGRLNYLWSINSVSNSHWQGIEPNSGTPVHAPRKIFEAPAAFEFAEPVGGTYPVWYDPTYWYEGSVSRFDFRGQLRVVAKAVGSYYELFQAWGIQYGLAVAVISFYLIGHRGRQLIQDWGGQWPLLLPALAGFGMYALVNVQGRYVAPFLVLLWLALFAAVRLRATSESEAFMKVVMIVLAGSIILTTVASSNREAILTVRHLVRGEDPLAHEQWQVSEGLREMGLTANDKVAFIGHSTRAFWAHLLNVRIVADIRTDNISDFWTADPNLRSQVIDAFANTGVKAVVAEKPLAGTDLTNWRKIRKTDYYVVILR